MVSLLDVEILKDPKYKTQPARLADKVLIDGVLNEIFATRSTAHWVEKLSSVRVPCAPVNRFSEALSDPQVRHRQMVVEISHPEGGTVEVPGNPIKLSADSDETYSPPPLLGEHTDAVLKRVLGYDSARVAELKSQRVVG